MWCVRRCDLIGIDALHGEALSGGREPYEVRLRVAGRTETYAGAVRIGNAVETLYTNGPAALQFRVEGRLEGRRDAVVGARRTR
jgi:hypothetical protein